MLDATRLRVLVAVARHGSVTAAAQALNYAQPSISHHIARLEAETGAKLMERAGRGVRLTEAGQLLAERATEILGRLDAAEAELAAHVGLRQDRVRLAAFGLALATLVAAAAAAARTERAATDLLLIHAEPADAMRLLKTGAADAALTYRYLRAGTEPGPPDPAAHAEDLRYQLVLDEPLFLVTPGGGAADPPSLADCATNRWIAGGAPDEAFLIELCRAVGHFTPNVAVHTGDYVAAQALVAAGSGVTVLPGLARQAADVPGVRWAELGAARHQVVAVTYRSAQPSTTWLVEALCR
jgi:DNA-binding transcriptional LysR family regulator